MDDKMIKALGDPVRFRLLQLLGEGAYCVGALSKMCGVSESAVSQHLKILREAGLVYGVKLGYYTHYRLQREALEDAIRQLDAILHSEPRRCSGGSWECAQAEAIGCKNLAKKKQQETGKGETKC